MPKLKVNDEVTNSRVTYKMTKIDDKCYYFIYKNKQPQPYSIPIKTIDMMLSSGVLKKVPSGWEKHRERMING